LFAMQETVYKRIMMYTFIDGETVWKIHATHGFPLELSIPELAERGFMVTWLELLIAAQKDGANLETLIARLEAIACDSYPKHISGPILERFAAISSWFPKL